VIYVVDRDARLVEALSDGLFREAVEMLLAVESLLFGGGNEPAVSQEGCA